MDIKDRIDRIFNSSCVKYFNNTCIITEPNKSGKAKCNVFLIDEEGKSVDGILFNHIDDNGWKFFDCLKASDQIILKKENNDWVLNVFEIKRTIDDANWEKISFQFYGSYLHGIALCKMLNLSISNVKFHTVFHRDKLGGNSNNIYEMKYNQKNLDKVYNKNDWFREQFKIDDYETNEKIKCEHIKHDVPEVDNIMVDNIYI